MTVVDVALPVTLIILKFLFRLFGHKASTWTEIVQAAIMLPIDMLFLAFSFCAAVAVAKGDSIAGSKWSMIGTLWLVIMTFIVVYCCRESEQRYIRDMGGASLSLFMVSFFISAFTVIGSVALVGSL
jgi:hypothetical protein